MKGALGCLVGLVLLVAGLVFVAVAGVGSALWRLRRNLRKGARHAAHRPQEDGQRADASASKRKIYAPDEGEYVDFEEVDASPRDND